jgi:FkbM family methyltransferase
VTQNGPARLTLEEYEAFQPTTEVACEGRRLVFCTPNRMTAWRAQSLFDKEPDTVRWILGFEPGARFLDVGANVGVYTILAGVVRQARVAAFEPEAQNYALLNRNIHANGLGRAAVAYCAALSDHAGASLLYLSQFEAGVSCHSLGEEVGFDLAPRPAAFAQGVFGYRIDDLVAAGTLEVPSYVKIDVDGFEHKVVEGARATLAHPEVRGLLIEINHNLEEHLDLVEELGAIGYRHDPAQVARAERKSGTFKGQAEYVFRR